MAQTLRQNTLTDQNARPIAGANIYVYDNTGVPAVLTSDGTTPLSQPVITDTFGNYKYYANTGVYTEDLFLGTHRIWEQVIAIGTGADVSTLAALAASGGSALVGFQLPGTGTIARTAQAKLGDIGHYSDFNIKADGVTDDTTAVQNALNWLAPGRTLIMPGTDVKISSTITLGNGTTTALSTIANNSKIFWGGEIGDYDALIRDPADPGTAADKAGTRFVWAGAAGGTMMKWLGPITGVIMIGALILDCNDPTGAGTGALYGLDARSFSGFKTGTVGAFNWSPTGRGILLTTQQVTTIGGNANPVLSSKNDFGRLVAFSAYATASECIRLDGYRAASGSDVTVSRFRYIETGFNGTGGKGLVLGFTDNCIIDHFDSLLYGAIGTGGNIPYGLYLDGGAVPFQFPATTRIHQMAIAGAVGVGGGTNSQVTVGQYLLDDGALIPSGVSGLIIEHLCQSGTTIDQMAYPSTGKTKTRAIGNGDGWFGYDASGTHMHSLTRQGTAAHVSGNGDVEFEAGATGGPTTGKHFKVTTTGAGYPTGVGGAITQLTSRTTGVTLNTVCGQITLVSAAGSATWATFTVTNSNVAATDVIRLSQASGTDKYMLHVTGVRAGAFDISFATTGGTTTEQPVFNFAVLKASAS